MTINVPSNSEFQDTQGMDQESNFSEVKEISTYQTCLYIERIKREYITLKHKTRLGYFLRLRSNSEYHYFKEFSTTFQ